MSTTICVSQEGPANALALNKDCSQVVIAGRNVFKVFSIDTEFNEVCNLRVGKNLNLNFSSIDVAWSTIEENTLATAATNGAVVVWNLSRSGRSKQEHVFSDHKRTVNKVSFHLTEPALLISGSQDGTMKCFDLRAKEVARTFLSNTESVRDVQFSPHSSNIFAAVSENGGVQLWDVRRAERCIHQFTAHSGPVFACDWHPEYPWLATASRDKTIKVWDIHGRPSLEYTIHTIASVGHVKWRPQRRYHIASCALVLDSSVNIWDVRRPCIPLATFDEHRDVTTAVAWAGEPDVFLSTSRDCTLYRHTFRDAVHPAMAANPHGVGVGARGDIALASAQHRAPPTPQTFADKIHTFIGRKQSTSSVSATTPTSTPSCTMLASQQQQQLQLEATFHTSAASSMRCWTASTTDKTSGGVAAFVACAKKYRIAGCLLSICEHNAAVAKEHGKYQVSLVWLVIKMIYASKATSPKQESNSTPSQLSKEDGSNTMAGPNLASGTQGLSGANAGTGTAAPESSGTGDLHNSDGYDVAGDRRPRTDQKPIYSSFQIDDDAETDDGSDHQFHNSGVLGFPTQNIHIPRASHACYNDDNRNWLTAGSAHYVDSSSQDWTLQGEAFILRSSVNPQHLTDGQSTTSSTFAENETSLDAYEGHNYSHNTSLGGQIGGNASLTSGIQSASSISLSNSPTANQLSSIGSGEESLVCRYAAGAGGGESWAASAHVAAALRLHAELGDVQTSVTVLLVLGELRNTLSGHLDEMTQEHWLVSYLDLLGRHKLWDICTQIIQCAWLASISQMSQQSTTVHASCGRCGRTLPPPLPAANAAPPVGAALCDRCGPPAPSTCTICHQVVRGLYAWCQGCSHGGHAAHIHDWLKENKQCPAGCGHLCEYS